MTLRRDFARLQEARDGVELHKLLRFTEHQPCPTDEEASKENDDPVAGAIVRAWSKGISEESIEVLSGALKQWCAKYLEVGGNASWMVLPLMWLASRPRRLAVQLDAGSSERHLKKLVEVLREQFNKLHRSREKRQGSLVMCCELLRLYFRLGQASQCTFLLAAVTKRDSVEPEALPKALAVTLCFMWGKHCVLDGNVLEANEKLSWALANCPEEHTGNRRRILVYLVPCRLRMGKYPSRKLLERHGMQGLAGICRATSSGNVRLFDSEFERQETWLIHMGTYLMVEKLKLLVYRNLCLRVHREVAADLEKIGKADQRHKQDIRPYELAFRWQEDTDSDETLGILANLIYIGAIRGYMSDEHHKIVFSKDTPFPAPEIWSPKV